jgi:hypothetical protein
VAKARRKRKAKRPASAAAADSVDRLWKHVLAHWAEDTAHVAFLEHCRSRQELGRAAQSYRAHLEAAGNTPDPDLRAQVDKRLAGIRALAIADFESVSRAEERSLGWVRGALTLLALALLVAAIITLLSALGAGKDVGLPHWAALVHGP